MSIILKTATFSLIVQVIIACIGVYGLTFKLPSNMAILQQLLFMETVVQIIELVYYIWLIQNFTSIHYDVTFTRYFDWVFSTPIMIVSTVLYMKYRTTAISTDTQKESKPSNSFPTIPKLETMATPTPVDHSPESGTNVTFWTLLFENATAIIWILCFNWVMLLFGFLGERQIISRATAFIWGSLAFVASFYMILAYFVGNDPVNQVLFWVMFIIWGMYGVAFCFSYTTKNAMYNCLDIFSKNFYGLFLYYEVKKASLLTTISPRIHWSPK